MALYVVQLPCPNPQWEGGRIWSCYLLLLAGGGFVGGDLGCDKPKC